MYEYILFIPDYATGDEAYKTDILERREMNMYKDFCEHPEKLKGKPEGCHGDEKNHPCVPKKEGK